MKTTSIILTVLVMTMSSFSRPVEQTPKDLQIAAEKMAGQVVHALRKQSAFDYSVLYPTLDGFNQMFDETAAFYGHNFAVAKEEFEGRYLTQIIPTLNKSFQDLITNGQQKGIDWRTISLSQVRTESANSDTPVELTIECSGAKHVIRFAKTILMNGELKVSASVSID